MGAQEEKTTRIVSFRLPMEAWQQLEAATKGSPTTPHDWCRNLVLNELDHGHGLTRNEQYLLGEIAIIRYILTNAFSSIAAGKQLTADDWMKVERTSVEAGQKVADEVLIKRLQKRAH